MNRLTNYPHSNASPSEPWIEDAERLPFRRLSYHPFYLVHVIKLVALDPALSLVGPYQRVFDVLASQPDYPGRWRRTKSLDRLVYVGIAAPVRGVAAQRVRDIGWQNDHRFRGAKTVRRLMNAPAISPGGERGRYFTELPGFAEWCTQRED